MTIKTAYNVGQYLKHDGKVYQIIGVQVYYSNRGQNEGYYLGNNIWHWIKRINPPL